ncbi:nematode cuticle collagen domain protein, partial [Teladorsagia circumcincta]
MGDDDKCNKAALAASQKQFAFIGIAVSTIATLTAIIAVPMLCMHMHSVHSGIQEELAFCRSKTTGLQAEFIKLEGVRSEALRAKRQYPELCCSCGIAVISQVRSSYDCDPLQRIMFSGEDDIKPFSIKQ